MAVKIDGTVVKKSGGGGLGKLLGTVAGGIAGSFIGQPMLGASIGGGLGGAIGGAIKPGSQTDLGVAVKGATGASTSAQPNSTSAIDRINGVLDIGQTVAGGADALNNLSAPKGLKLGKPMAVDSSNAFSRRMNTGGMA